MKKKDDTNRHLVNDNASSGYRMSAKQYSENGEMNQEEMSEFRHGY